MPSMRRSPLILLALALAACAGHAPRPSDAAALAERHRAPLAARLLPPDHRTLNFVLSEPAYVTIFEIVPGRGVSVIYPAPFDVGATRSLSTGSHAVFAVPMNVGRWFYSDLPMSVAAARPTFLYMIASREPLRIDPVLDDPALLRRTVGFATFTHSNEQRVMDALDDSFVPAGLDDDSWTSDWIALWPEPALSRPPVDPRAAVTGCAEGVVVLVPGPTPAYVCAPVDTRRPPTPNQPGDTAAAPTQPREPADKPADKPAKPAPRDGRRPSAPRQVRTEPMTIVVDYGSRKNVQGFRPAVPGARPSSPRAAYRYERPWERDGAATTRRGYEGRDSYESVERRAASSPGATAQRESARRAAEPRIEPVPPAPAPSANAPRSAGQGQ